MAGSFLKGGWRSSLRWIGLLAFGGLLGFAIWSDVSAGGVNAVQAIEAKRVAKTYDDAVRAAQDAVRKAHASGLASCSEMTDSCRASAEAAARKAALTVLTDGGCLDWEMSEWSPTRGRNEPGKPKSRAEAENACALLAGELAERMSEWSRRQK